MVQARGFYEGTLGLFPENVSETPGVSTKSAEGRLRLQQLTWGMSLVRKVQWWDSKSMI